MRADGRRAAAVIGGAIAAAATVAAALVAFTQTGRYLVRAAWAEGRILARRRPITDVITDPATPPSLRSKLQVVLDARHFAAATVGLRAQESFTTFAELDHDTLVLVLSGAYRDRLRPITWWFPIVGRVPYKGYFDFDAAVRAASALRAQGFDAFVRPAAAFSTLGWFNDPVVSTTLRADTLDLANTVIHELTHNTYYAAGHADFNESFANFVGARGAAAFFRSRGDSAAAREVEDRWADEKVLGRFWTSVYDELAAAFARHPADTPADRAARLAARDTIFARARDSLTTTLPLRLRTVPAAALARARLDNAALLARRVYLMSLDDFDAVYVRCGGDLARAVRRIIGLARHNRRDPFGAVGHWIGDPGARCGGGG